MYIAMVFMPTNSCQMAGKDCLEIKFGLMIYRSLIASLAYTKDVKNYPKVQPRILGGLLIEGN